jgi:hypothetical protein
MSVRLTRRQRREKLLDFARTLRLASPPEIHRPRRNAVQAALAFASRAFDDPAFFEAPSPLAFLPSPDVDFTSHVSHLRSHVEGVAEGFPVLL